MTETAAKRGPTLVCETCGGLTWATLANSCHVCVAEDEDIKAARRVLAKVEMAVEQARQERRSDGGPVSPIDRAAMSTDGEDRTNET